MSEACRQILFPARPDGVRRALAVSCVASVWVQHLGATRFPCSWNKSPVHVDRAPERVWSWSDTQIARCAGW
jgi:hypothetical protein